MDSSTLDIEAEESMVVVDFSLESSTETSFVSGGMNNGNSYFSSCLQHENSEISKNEKLAS